MRHLVACLVACLLLGCDSSSSDNTSQLPPLGPVQPGANSGTAAPGLGGVGNTGNTGNTGSSGIVTPGLPPSILLGTPASPAGAALTLSYTLSDVDSHPADLEVEFSIDGGQTYLPARDAGASAGSAGTSALPTSVAGLAGVFVWDARADIGAQLRHFVRLRVTPSDVDGAGASQETSDLIVDAGAAAGRCYNFVVPLDPQGPDSMTGFDVAQTGLSLRAGSPWTTGGEGRQMSSLSGLCADALGRWVFASHNRSAAIEVFAVQANGDLLPVAGSPFPTADNPSSLTVHPSGRFLYTCNNNEVEGFAIDQTTGALSALAGSPYVVGSSPRGIAIDPKGDALYSGHMFGADRGLVVHNLDPQTGVLSASSSFPLNTSLASRPGKHLAVSPDGTRLVCSDLDKGIFVFDVDRATRALSLAQPAPYDLGGFLSGAMTLNTHGTVLYVTVTGQGLHSFALGAAGALQPLGSVLPGVGATALYLSTDTLDSRLVLSSRSDDRLHVYALDPQTGAASELASSPVANPNPAGRAGPVLLVP